MVLGEAALGVPFARWRGVGLVYAVLHSRV